MQSVRPKYRANNTYRAFPNRNMHQRRLYSTCISEQSGHILTSLLTQCMDFIQSGTWRLYNVVSMSIMRRCFNVACPLRYILLATGAGWSWSTLVTYVTRSISNWRGSYFFYLFTFSSIQRFCKQRRPSSIAKTCLFKYTENYTTKMKLFR